MGERRRPLQQWGYSRQSACCTCMHALEMSLVGAHARGEFGRRNERKREDKPPLP